MFACCRWKSLAIVAALSLPLLDLSAQTLDQVVVQSGYIINGEIAAVTSAMVNGYYKDEGLSVTIRPAFSGTTFLDATVVLSQDRSVDIAIANDIETLLHAKGGVSGVDPKSFRVKAFGSLWQDNPSAAIVRKTTGLSSLKDLKTKPKGGGKWTIGFGGGDWIIDAIAKYAGIGRNDLDVKIVGFDLSSLLSGQVDVYLGYWPVHAYLAEVAGIDYSILPLSEMPGYKNPSLVLLAREDTIRDRAGVLLRFVRATTKGAQFVISNPAAATSTVLNPSVGSSGLDPKQEAWLVNNSVPLYKPARPDSPLLSIDLEMLQMHANWEYQYAQITRIPSIDELVDIALIKTLFGGR